DGIARGNQEGKHIAVAVAVLEQIITFKGAVLAVLLEDNILLASGRTARAGGIQRIEAHPGLDREIRRPQRRRVRDLHVAVRAIKPKSRSDQANRVRGCTALEGSVVGSGDVI